jgi:nucleoid-associated protein YgaU
MPEKDPNKPDFSDVVGGSSSTAPSSKGRPAGAAAGAAAGGTGTQADGFKDVVSGSSSTAASSKGVEARTYIVQSGDSLSKIAKKFYGNANEWRRIFEANKDRISNPDMIQPGWALKIPE